MYISNIHSIAGAIFNLFVAQFEYSIKAIYDIIGKYKMFTPYKSVIFSIHNFSITNNTL